MKVGVDRGSCDSRIDQAVEDALVVEIDWHGQAVRRSRIRHVEPVRAQTGGETVGLRLQSPTGVVPWPGEGPSHLAQIR